MKNLIENKNKLIYSLAKSEDEAEIINLLRSLGGDRSNFNIADFYIAKDNNQLVGCIRTKTFIDGGLELASLAVNPTHQHQRVGSRLVHGLLTIEKRRPIFLLTEKNKENFYQKFGFSIITPKNLPEEFKKEYDRIISLPFTKNLEVIAMIVK